MVKAIVYERYGPPGVVLATWFIRPELSGKRRLSCYFALIIFREQQNRQNPSLATRARQTLDKTRHFSPNHRHTFRSNPQPNRSGCRKCIVAPTTDRAESTDQTTTANQPWSFSLGVSIALYEVLETSSSYRSARYPFALASGTIWHVLAEEIARQAKDFCWNDCLDWKDGGRESVMGSGANVVNC